ncbi:hypothetical protein PENSTE_c006G07796 [Penicillium steckii]|uniref:Uncharacterized protein n=1 Tax=Penicillium steckii TaxID=303698 RepID=A0A1V6THN3_9EURO|nr:hypothetical protein PENSTE_c006G07796 [Penicillium steckii]
MKFLSVIGLLSSGIATVNAIPGSGTKVNQGKQGEETHTPGFWSGSGDTRTHAYIWSSEQTSYSPSTKYWYTDTTVAHTTTKYISPGPHNKTVVESDKSTISWKLTSTTTFSTTATYVSSSLTTSVNPCPTSCKVSAGTVNLFYWPTDQPYEYPTTHFDSHLDYTFTSPSVYMIVDKIYGTNTAGEIAGPSGTSVIFPLDLNEVSTIVPNISATHQLTLNDLRTDCPQTEPASVIATKIPGGPCDPILAAPKKVKSWASPCGACQNFGLFDPPYAVTPLSGGLVPVTTTTMEPAPQTTTTIASPTQTATEPATETATTEETTASPTPESTSTSEAVTLTESSGSYVGTIPVALPTSSASQYASEASTASPESSTASAASETETDIGVSSGVSSMSTPGSSSSSGLSSASSTGAAPSSSTPAFSAATKLSGSLTLITSFMIGVFLL